MMMFDPTLVGDALLACGELCEQLDYLLTIDYRGAKAYARDPSTMQFTLWAGGDTWLDAVIQLIAKLQIVRDTLRKQNPQ